MTAEPLPDVRCKACGKNFAPASLDETGACPECRPSPATPAGADSEVGAQAGEEPGQHQH